MTHVFYMNYQRFCGQLSEAKQLLFNCVSIKAFPVMIPLGAEAVFLIARPLILTGAVHSCLSGQFGCAAAGLFCSTADSGLLKRVFFYVSESCFIVYKHGLLDLGSHTLWVTKPPDMCKFSP